MGGRERTNKRVTDLGHEVPHAVREPLGVLFFLSVRRRSSRTNTRAEQKKSARCTYAHVRKYVRVCVCVGSGQVRLCQVVSGLATQNKLERERKTEEERKTARKRKTERERKN